MMEYILFPGRHHMVTAFQVRYLSSLLEKFPSAQIIWAVTSSTHSGTRRNPLPSHRREAMIEGVAANESLPSLVALIPDTPQSERFAHTTLRTVEHELSVNLTPQNTAVACSTPAVSKLYESLGYEVFPVEAGEDPQPLLPWDVLELMVAQDPTWKTLAHPKCVQFYRRYGLEPIVRRINQDPTVSSEGDLTETRDYRTYSAAFDEGSERKWSLVRDHVQPGTIVDLGCAAGGLLEQASREPALEESDLYGVDISRHLVAEAEHRKSQGFFHNPNVFFLQRNLLHAPIFAPSSVNTTLTVALTHEISSYGAGVKDLKALAGRIFEHTVPGGVWVNSDVLGPEDSERSVLLELSGARLDALELESLPAQAQAAHLRSLSPASKFEQFARDFPRLSGAEFDYEWVGEHEVKLSLKNAMEFLYTRDYDDNFLSECHERFCDMSFSSWSELLTSVGFVLERPSGSWRNDWLVENRLSRGALLKDLDGSALAWPDTHVLLVARKQL